MLLFFTRQFVLERKQTAFTVEPPGYEGMRITMQYFIDVQGKLPVVEFKTTYQADRNFAIHYHRNYELYYFVEGDADYLVEGKEYHLTPNSLLLLSPYAFHGVRINSSKPYTRCAVHFSSEYLSPEHRSLLLSPFPGSQINNPQEIFYEHTESFGLKLYLEHLIVSQKQPSPVREELYTIYMEALLSQIYIMSRTLTPSCVTNSTPDTIREVLNYLNAHVTENITLDALSERFFISKYYMNRAFKKATGSTVIEYLLYKRVVLARYFLHNGMTAAEAAVQAGFGDYSGFYRAHRKLFGCGPGKERNG